MSLSSAVDRSLSHHAPKPVSDQVARIEALRAAAKVFAAAVEDNVGEVIPGASMAIFRKPTREKSLAITKIEEALMWAVKGVVLE